MFMVRLQFSEKNLASDCGPQWTARRTPWFLALGAASPKRPARGGASTHGSLDKGGSLTALLDAQHKLATRGIPLRYRAATFLKAITTLSASPLDFPAPFKDGAIREIDRFRALLTSLKPSRSEYSTISMRHAIIQSCFPITVPCSGLTPMELVRHVLS